uniref:Uncharacterized protein n=1 Tax=Myotis myotis TaxID=51298 RepID=A0A7J7XHJ6_MYOMY|nr:hypothetical protein mMyoMyo1_011721 [Myotis myotis]
MTNTHFQFLRAKNLGVTYRLSWLRISHEAAIKGPPHLKARLRMEEPVSPSCGCWHSEASAPLQVALPTELLGHLHSVAANAPAPPPAPPSEWFHSEQAEATCLMSYPLKSHSILYSILTAHSIH